MKLLEKTYNMYSQNLSPIGKLGIIWQPTTIMVRRSQKKESINSWVEMFVIGKYNEENM